MARRASDSTWLSLSSVLQALPRAQLQLELRDDTHLQGTLEEADGFMKCDARSPTSLPAHCERTLVCACSLSLSGVRIQRWPGGPVLEEELLHVKGTSIRFVQLPEEADVAVLMRNKVRHQPWPILS